jgi:hypothetical protein
MNSYEEFFAGTQPRRRARPQPRVVKSEREAPMVLRGAEKEIAENNAQLRRYLRWKAIEMKQLPDGECGAEIRELQNILRELTPADVSRFLDFMIEHGWFQHLDRTTRIIILGMINTGICRMRVREGLPMMDDSLPGEPATVFEICRAELNPERT